MKQRKKRSTKNEQKLKDKNIIQEVDNVDVDLKDKNIIQEVDNVDVDLKDKNIIQEVDNIDIDNLPTPRTNNDNIEENEKMAKNDPVQDAINPPGNLSHDFEDYTFDSLEIAEVFWQTNQPGDNIPWRKMSETQAMNLKKGTLHTFIRNTVVWQKI